MKFRSVLHSDDKNRVRPIDGEGLIGGKRPTRRANSQSGGVQQFLILEQ